MTLARKSRFPVRLLRLVAQGGSRLRLRFAKRIGMTARNDKGFN
jgi:hypothetical protein